MLEAPAFMPGSINQERLRKHCQLWWGWCRDGPVRPAASYVCPPRRVALQANPWRRL